MDGIRKYINLIFGSRLFLATSGRTMLKLPIWIAVLFALNNIPLAVITALAVIGLGMQVTVERG